MQLRGTSLLYYKNQKDADKGEPIGMLPLRECERSENSSDRSFDVVYGGTKYVFLLAIKIEVALAKNWSVFHPR